MTLVCCGSLASVLRHKPASPSRVSASCSALPHCSFFLAQVCKHRLASVLQERSSRSEQLEAASSLYWWDSLSSPHACLSYSVPVIPTRESSPRPEPGVCGRGPCICGEPGASQSQWSETASEGAAFLLNLAVGFVIGMCTCVTFAVPSVGFL